MKAVSNHTNQKNHKKQGSGLVYTIWCAFWFGLIFLLLFPFTFIFLQRESWKPYAHKINHIWGRIFFFVVGIRIEVDYQYRPAPNQTYVFCANHFSYMDIAVMGVILRNYYAFVGKHGLKRVPLFGYMFAKLHIQVNREKANSRAYSLTKSIKTLRSGRSIVIYPEGGIRSAEPPRMYYPFKDGAFKMAIQEKVPIVPVTLLTNHLILPDVLPLRMHRHPVKAIVHPPIETRNLTQDDMEWLKEKTFRIIEEALMKSSVDSHPSSVASPQ